MRTTVLYKSDPLLLEYTAEVISVLHTTRDQVQVTFVVLDKTPFYPEGGGQPADTGTIKNYPVYDVIEHNNEIVHVLPVDAQLVQGEKVYCKVDFDRRRDHTEQHSGQHLLSTNFLRILGAPTRSFHLGEAYSTIDIDIPVLEKQDAVFVENVVNKMIADNYSYKIFTCTYDEALKLPLRRKPPEGESEIRIIEIDGFDFTPCCGTHVRESREIQLLKIIKYEKYKGMTRVYFVAGMRAIAWLSRLYEQAQLSAQSLGCNIENIGDTAKVFKEKYDNQEKMLLYWKFKSAEQEASRLAAEIKASGKSSIITEINEDFAYCTKLAKNLADLDIKSCIVSSSELRAAISIPKSVSIILQDSLKPLLEKHALKGGGGRDFYQVSFANVLQSEQFTNEMKTFFLS
ncbi:MAG TPA: alanyl-tRNA editing protein [Spirochaetales bacterium]|nr:alanyl-tRNA editing protein [Spirochaetales bacterium]HPD80118.1 alanyl-tRNA editing protein [Spirochaetales bacterium]HQK33768.1 alanyl-tRNA editing protein [Spirochaetales bacterium]